MIGTTITPKITISRLSRKIRRDHPLQVKACEVDGYGNYGCQLVDALQVASPKLNATSPIVDVSAEEFEAVYRWFWS